MSGSAIAPVVAGLAIGIAFIVLFAMSFPPSSSSSNNFEPRISKEKAVEIAVHDLTTRYIENPPVIKIYAIIDKQSQEAAYPTVETFLKEENNTLVMAHAAANGSAFYFIDANTLSLEECHVPYCPLGEPGMSALKGRFAWIVELATQCDEYPNYGADITYAIDAKTGQILWRHNSSADEPEHLHVCS